MSPVRILVAYRLAFCVLIIIASAHSLVAEHAHHIRLLAAAEIAGALLLVWNKTQLAGVTLLLLVFAAAQAIAATEGEYPTRFLQYAASALLIVGLSRAFAQTQRPSDGAGGAKR